MAIDGDEELLQDFLVEAEEILEQLRFRIQSVLKARMIQSK